MLRDLVTSPPADILQARSALHPLSVLHSSLISRLLCQRVHHACQGKRTPSNPHVMAARFSAPSPSLPQEAKRLLPGCTAPATPLSQLCCAANAAIPSQTAPEDHEDFSSTSSLRGCSGPAASSTSLAASWEDGSYHASWHSPTKGCHWGSVYHLQAKH